MELYIGEAQKSDFMAMTEREKDLVKIVTNAAISVAALFVTIFIISKAWKSGQK